MKHFEKCVLCGNEMGIGQNVVQCNNCKRCFHSNCAFSSFTTYKCPICKDIWKPLDTHVTKLKGPIYEKKMKKIKMTHRVMKGSKRRKQTRRRRR